MMYVQSYSPSTLCNCKDWGENQNTRRVIKLVPTNWVILCRYKNKEILDALLSYIAK